jgi:NADH dehydrogenase
VARRIGYDQLVICSGSRRAIELSARNQHGVDNHAEALALRKALDRFGSRRPRVAVIGSSFTGLEVATELAKRADVALIERQSQIAPEFGAAARKLIEQALESLNIEVHRNSDVMLSDEGQAVVRSGRELDMDLIVWATGLEAWDVASESGFQPDDLGRIPVDETLFTGVDGVWAAGDCARAKVDGQHVAPMSCQHAMPMGARAGANAARAAFGLRPDPYSQPFYLTCLDLGGAGALLTAGFERNDVLASGDSAKQFKRYINRHLIYPPVHDADALLKLGAAEPANAAAAALQRTALRSSLVRRTLTASAHDRAADHLTT